MENTEQLKAENEMLRQELHVVKRKLDIANKITAGLSEELEQQQDRSTRDAREIRAQYGNLLKAHETTIEKLKAEMQEKNNPEPIIAVRKEPIVVQAEHTNSNALDWEELEAQHKEEICILEQKLATIGQEFAQSQWKISELNEEVDCLKEQLASQKGNIQIKTQQLTELRELLESTQEQNGMLSAELARIRSDPTDTNQKGNSLFAEVADQRKKLMNNITQIKARYFELKREHQNCPRQIRELQNMQQRSERLYEQCVKLIRSAEYYNVKTLKEQNNDLHEQVEEAKRRIRYLENDMGTKSADWVSKLLTLNREEKQKLEIRLRSYQFRQREAMELHEDAVKESWKWQIEAQRLKMKALNMEVPSVPVESSASTAEIAEMKDKSGTQPIEASCTSDKEPLVEAACTTITEEHLPAPLPIPGGELQAAKKEAEQTMAKFKIVPLKCYKISDLMAMHKEQKKPKDNAQDVEVDLKTGNSASETMPK